MLVQRFTVDGGLTSNQHRINILCLLGLVIVVLRLCMLIVRLCHCQSAHGLKNKSHKWRSACSEGPMIEDCTV